MKTRFQIIVIMLAAIYCFAITTIADSTKDTASTEQDQHFEFLSNKLLYHTTQSESSVNQFSSFTVPNLKSSFDKYWSITKNIGLLLNSFLLNTSISQIIR